MRSEGAGGYRSMSRRMAIAWARELWERTFHLFRVTDLATLRVRIVITGGRIVSRSISTDDMYGLFLRSSSGSGSSPGSCCS
jgi:hypothetical protein